MIFNSDIFDENDFKSLEDYRKVGMYNNAIDNIKKAVNFIDSELTYVHIRSSKSSSLTEIKRIIVSNFKDVIPDLDKPKVNTSSPSVCGGAVDTSRDSLEKTVINKYEDITQTCFANKTDVPMGLWLSQDCNIVIKNNDKYYGFKREDIIRAIRTNKIIGVSKIKVNESDVFINYRSIEAFDDYSYKYYETIDSGLTSSKGIKRDIHNVIPYTVKILRKHLEI
jgi:hypothetical protein